MKTIAIIQARMGSTRLPGKMLMDIAGRPAVAHVVGRVRNAHTVNTVVLATTTEAGDDALADWAEKNGVPCYRGSANDVLDRYYEAAKQYGADVVVRITGDCPLADPAVIDRVVSAYQEGDCEYASNTIQPTYPDGLDCEVFSFVALEKAWKEALLPSEREHATPYIWKHPELFRLKSVSCDTDYSAHRWTLDTPEDLVFLQHLVAACEAQGNCDMASVLALEETHPEWREMNAMHTRNEGYQKSLVADGLQ
jgi:spore coat polysaccharide biosynthesis protein SpsF (cytidylyltransferase family)